jgi:hypothetical protein
VLVKEARHVLRRLAQMAPRLQVRQPLRRLQIELSHAQRYLLLQLLLPVVRLHHRRQRRRLLLLLLLLFLLLLAVALAQRILLPLPLPLPLLPLLLLLPLLVMLLRWDLLVEAARLDEAVGDSHQPLQPPCPQRRLLLQPPRRLHPAQHGVAA